MSQGLKTKLRKIFSVSLQYHVQNSGIVAVDKLISVFSKTAMLHFFFKLLAR